MPKYNVQIARTETTVYYIEEIEAEDEDQAEEIAYQRFEDGDYDKQKVVFGEELTHDIEEIAE